MDVLRESNDIIKKTEEDKKSIDNIPTQYILSKIKWLVDWILNQEYFNHTFVKIELIDNLKSVIECSEALPERNRFYYLLYFVTTTVLSFYLSINLDEIRNFDKYGFPIDAVRAHMRIICGNSRFSEQFTELKTKLRQNFMIIKNHLNDDEFSKFKNFEIFGRYK